MWPSSTGKFLKRPVAWKRSDSTGVPKIAVILKAARNRQDAYNAIRDYN